MTRITTAIIDQYDDPDNLAVRIKIGSWEMYDPIIILPNQGVLIRRMQPRIYVISREQY